MHDARLSPETLLQLAPTIRARFDAVGHVLVDSPGGTIVDVGPRGFATLALLRGRWPSGMRSRGSKPMSAARPTSCRR